MITIQLKPKKEESLQRFHPWVFSGAIQKIEGKPTEGDLVEVLDCNRNFLALGHYQIGSIAVRVVSFEKVEINDNFWNNHLIKHDMRHCFNLHVIMKHTFILNITCYY